LVAATRSTAPFDVTLGARVRERRLRLRLTQRALARMIGVGYRQLQKYEGGFNRIHPAELLALAVALKTTVADLVGEARPSVLGVMGHGWDRPDSLALVDAFVKIESAEVRRLVIGIARAMATEASLSSDGDGDAVEEA
jgi:transcriptional regulator with XRE-family HTH domain